MVYSWDDKEAVCYRLYVEERRSLEEVICYWEIRGFTPRYADCASCIHRWPYRIDTGGASFSSRADFSNPHVLTLHLQQTRLSDTVQGSRRQVPNSNCG